jgi:hypothetical protein
LAEYVINGKKFQRLFWFLYGEVPDIDTMNAMERAFMGWEDGRAGQPVTMEELLDRSRTKYERQEGYQLMRR